MNDSSSISWIEAPVAELDTEAASQAEARQAALTKPPGSLGRLEHLAVRLAGLQGTQQPETDRVHITVFAGDHGIAAENVSAFPQSVTAEMLRNFAAGGAAISVIARHIGAELEVINLGTVHDTATLEGVRNHVLGPGTANFAEQASMDGEQLSQAMGAGRDAVTRARQTGARLFIGGEMGIANTTAATALACSLLEAEPSELSGPGTGLDAEGVSHKAGVIQSALALHRDRIRKPVDALRYLGGFEMAALTGACIACAQRGTPVLVDGFISSVAALTAVRIKPGVEQWLLFSHVSAEPGHKAVLEALQAEPLLDLGMRLGEGSGAASAVPLLRLACKLHNRMATFDEAQVSRKRQD